MNSGVGGQQEQEIIYAVHFPSDRCVKATAHVGETMMILLVG